MTAITGLNPLPAQSRVAGYDKQLRMRATLKDFYVNLSGLFKRQETTIPNDIYMQIDEAAMRGSNTCTITMKLPLNGPIQVGNVNLSGTEEEARTKAATIYRNQYKKAVKVEDYGVRKLDQDPYGLYKQHIKDLGVYAQQYEGLEIRMAGVETYGYTLQFGDTAASCAPKWHPHIYVQGAMDIDQPAYDFNKVTYTNHIVEAMKAAGGGVLTPGEAQAATFRMFNKIAEKALDLKLMPLNINGNEAFILPISSRAAAMLNDPTFNTANGWASQWTSINRLNEKVQSWYGVIGAFRSAVGCDIYVVNDPKLPSLTPGGTASPWSLQAGYVWPGDVDLRDLANPLTRDASILLGKAALANWEPEALHFVKQDEDYFRIMGHGIAGVRGIQQVHFNQQNPLATEVEYYGSMLVIMARPAY